MEDSSVKPLLATTNTILIVIAVLFGLNLAADVCGWKSSTLVHEAEIQKLNIDLDIDGDHKISGKAPYQGVYPIEIDAN